MGKQQQAEHIRGETGASVVWTAFDEQVCFLFPGPFFFIEAYTL